MLKDKMMVIRALLCFICLFSIVSSSSQATNRIKKLEGTYVGRVDNGYSFCCRTGLEIEEIVVFNDILSVVVEIYPLQHDKHVGENFIISYTTSIEVWQDGNEGKSTILRLQKLPPAKHQPE